MEPDYQTLAGNGPLTREIPECMRDKYSVIQNAMDVLIFILGAIGHIVQALYWNIFGKPKKDLKGKVAVITGGGGGLGSLIALRLARLGVKIVLWDINQKGLEDTIKLVKGVGGECHGYLVDLANKEDIYRVAKKVAEDVGTVSLLINNAGVVSGRTFMDTPDELIKRTFNVNVLAHFWTVKAFLPGMIAASCGQIVTIASLAGQVGVPKLVDYCASKAAACGFDDALKIELEAMGVTGVKTTLVCPYFIRSTGMFDDVNARWVPILSSNVVADRVVLAIRRDEKYAILPGYLQILLCCKWMFPWGVQSSFLRAVVPDAAPDHGAPVKNGKTNGHIPNESSHMNGKDHGISNGISKGKEKYTLSDEKEQAILNGNGHLKRIRALSNGDIKADILNDINADLKVDELREFLTNESRVNGKSNVEAIPALRSRANVEATRL